MTKETKRFESCLLEHCITETEVVWWRAIGGSLTPEENLCHHKNYGGKGGRSLGKAMYL